MKKICCDMNITTKQLSSRKPRDKRRKGRKTGRKSERERGVKLINDVAS